MLTGRCTSSSYEDMSWVGLADLVPGQAVECVIHHADATREKIALDHSDTAAQRELFRAGSALNLLY